MPLLGLCSLVKSISRELLRHLFLDSFLPSTSLRFSQAASLLKLLKMSALKVRKKCCFLATAFWSRTSVLHCNGTGMSVICFSFALRLKLAEMFILHYDLWSWRDVLPVCVSKVATVAWSSDASLHSVRFSSCQAKYNLSIMESLQALICSTSKPALI